MKNQYEKIHAYVANRLDEGYGKESIGCYLHHHLCNEDYEEIKLEVQSLNITKVYYSHN